MTTQEQIAEWYHEHGCELSADSLAARIEAALGAASVTGYVIGRDTKRPWGVEVENDCSTAGVEALKRVQDE